MPAEFYGGVTIGEEFPPVNQAMVAMGSALQLARDQLLEFIRLLEEAKNAIRAPAVFPLQGPLDAALDFQAGFGAQISDPAAFVRDLLAGIAQVEAAIAQMGPPEVALQAELGASLEVSVGLELQIAAIDLQLALLDAIAEAIAFLRNQILPAVDAYAALANNLAVTGAYSFGYSGPLGSFGTQFDLVSPASGIPPGTGVLAVILLAPDTNAAAQAAIRATFRLG